MPDFLNHSRGFVCQPETTEADVAQVLDLNIERFCVPETLFSPSDIGISQMGIPEAINHAVSKCLLGSSDGLPFNFERTVTCLNACICPRVFMRILKLIP